MSSTTRLGFGIAAVFAAAILAFNFFGTRHESWFVRAAQENAVRCLTRSPCTLLSPEQGAVPNAPPLTSSSPCAKPSSWQQLPGVSNGQTNIVLTCNDGVTYLYHMGKLKGRDAGSEQWLVCRNASCAAEAQLVR